MIRHISRFLLTLLFTCNVTMAKPAFVGRFPYFSPMFGRESLLENINSFFQKGGNVSHINITGNSGMGKSLAARHYIEENKNQYDLIIWICCDREIEEQAFIATKFIENVDSTISAENNSSNMISNIERFKLSLQQTELKWLVIFDNAESQKQAEHLLVDNAVTQLGHYIITTQDNLFSDNSFNLKKLDNESSDALLSSILGIPKNNIIRNISESLGNHPSSVKQVALYIKETPSINLNDFQSSNTTRGKFMLLHSLKKAKTPFMLSIKKIKGASNQAYSLATICAFLNKDNIPQNLLSTWFYSLFGEDESGFHDSMNVLFSLEFLHKSDDYTNSGSQYYVHDIMHESMLESLSENEKKAALNNTISILNSNYLQNDKDSLKESTKDIFKHLTSITHHAINQGIKTRELYSICIDILEYLTITKRDFSLANFHSDNIEKYIESSGHEDLKIKFYTYRATYHESKGDFTASIDVIDKLSKSYNSYINKNPNKMKDVYSYYIQAKTYQATSYNVLGDYENSKKIWDEIEFLQKKHGYDCGVNSRWPLFVNKTQHKTIKYDRLFGLGKYKQALSLMNEILDDIEEFTKISEEDIGNEIFIWYISQKNLVSLMSKQDGLAFSERKKRIKDLFESYKQNTNKDAIDSTYGDILSSLAIVEVQSNNLIEAEKYATEALNVLNKIYSKQDVVPQQAFIHLIFAEIYQIQNNHIEAIDHLQIAEKIYKATLRSMKTENISIAYTLMAKSSLETNNEIALNFYVKEHEKIFGKDHHRHLMLVNHDFSSLIFGQT